MQSWCQYRNTYQFNEYPLNNVNITTNIEVCSTFNLTYNGVAYENKEEIRIEMPINQITVTKKDPNKKINNKFYNINTNNYKNIIYNKKDIAINLLNELDSLVLSIGNDIIRNYLIKNVVYKLDGRIMEIQVNQGNILVSFHRNIKQFDTEERLFFRKGYEKNNMCYSMLIDDFNQCNYVFSLIKQFYIFSKTPHENLSDKLLKELDKEISMISETVSCHIINKGFVYKDKRNFIFLNKTKYGVYIKMLNVQNNGILSIVTRKTYEPLCCCYKIKCIEDIKIIIPYIRKSYELNKIPPLDLKAELFKYYVSTS